MIQTTRKLTLAEFLALPVADVANEVIIAIYFGFIATPDLLELRTGKTTGSEG